MAEGSRAVAASTAPPISTRPQKKTIAARYSGAELVAPANIVDHLETNALTVVVEFVIDVPFAVDGQNLVRRTFDFRTDLIFSPVPDTGDEPESRRWPVMALVDGIYLHEVAVKLPDIGPDWSLDVGEETIENAAFRFRRPWRWTAERTRFGRS